MIRISETTRCWGYLREVNTHLRVFMRRGISIAVLAIVVASVVAPLALANPASVPACCRSGGQHHCMGMSGLDGFQSLPGECPYRVHRAVTTEKLP